MLNLNLGLKKHLKKTFLVSILSNCSSGHALYLSEGKFSEHCTIKTFSAKVDKTSNKAKSKKLDK